MGTGILGIRRVFLFLRAVIHRILALFASDTRLHTARFARSDELRQLLTPTPHSDGLLLGREQHRFFVTVRPTKARREMGNLLVVAPTRGGKGLLATSQLL